jgi:hypothetical protein
VFTHLPWLLLVGPPSGVPRAFMMAAGWVINLAVAEWVIRHQRRPLRIPNADVPQARHRPVTIQP